MLWTGEQLQPGGVAGGIFLHNDLLGFRGFHCNATFIPSIESLKIRNCLVSERFYSKEPQRHQAASSRSVQRLRHGGSTSGCLSFTVDGCPSHRDTAARRKTACHAPPTRGGKRKEKGERTGPRLACSPHSLISWQDAQADGALPQIRLSVAQQLRLLR